MNKQLRVLWHGVPEEYGTGYGVQTGLFTSYLKERRGVEVAVSSITPARPTYINSAGIKVFSCGQRNGALGNDFIMEHVDRFRPDVVVSMLDTFVMDKKKFRTLPLVAWQVVDSDPLMYELREPCGMTKVNLAMSRFGQRTIKDAGFDSTYIPLAVDTEGSYFLMDQSEARNALESTWGVKLPPTKYVIVSVMANMSRPSRKNFAAGLAAYKMFYEASPWLDTLYYIHSESTGCVHEGENLPRIAETLGIPPDRLLFPPTYEYTTGFFGPDYLRAVYNAADVMLYPTRGEGFGVPVIEAQACGCPVIATNCTSMPELLPHGRLVHKVNRYMHLPGSHWYEVDVPELAHALTEHVTSGVSLSCVADQSIPLTREGIRQSVEKYDISVVGENLLSVLHTAVDSGLLATDNNGVIS